LSWFANSPGLSSMWIQRGEPIIIPLECLGPELPALEEIAQIPDHLFVPSRVLRDGSEVRAPGYVAPFKMSVYKRVDYTEAGYVVVGNIGTRPGDEDVEDAVWADWQDYLPDVGALRQLVDSG
jgi:hypothetical protein